MALTNWERVEKGFELLCEGLSPLASIFTPGKLITHRPRGSADIDTQLATAPPRDIGRGPEQFRVKEDRVVRQGHGQSRLPGLGGAVCCGR